MVSMVAPWVVTEKLMTGLNRKRDHMDRTYKTAVHIRSSWQMLAVHVVHWGWNVHISVSNTSVICMGTHCCPSLGMSKARVL